MAGLSHDDCFMVYYGQRAMDRCRRGCRFLRLARSDESTTLVSFLLNVQGSKHFFFSCSGCPPPVSFHQHIAGGNTRGVSVCLLCCCSPRGDQSNWIFHGGRTAFCAPPSPRGRYLLPTPGGAQFQRRTLTPLISLYSPTHALSDDRCRYHQTDRAPARRILVKLCISLLRSPRRFLLRT